MRAERVRSGRRGASGLAGEGSSGATSTVLRFRPRSVITLAIASAAGLAMFLWPLILNPAAGSSHQNDSVVVFIVVLPVLLGVVLVELGGGAMDSKSLAMLGVLSAIGAALRPLGAGVAGVETVFFLLVLAGRTYGPAFGFVLGSTTLFASAVLTAGVGPWLPFQMLAASWVGLGAGLLPPLRGRAEVAMLAAYGALSALVFGFLMNMWFWPFSIGSDTSISFVAGDAVSSNLARFFAFSIATSTLGWDIGRAITNAAAIAIAGPAVLVTLRRAARRAAFEAPVVFDDSPVR